MNYIKAIIDRIEEETAVLNLGNGTNINFPKNKLPQNCIEGSAVRIYIAEDKDETTQTQTSAADILNDILNKEQ